MPKREYMESLTDKDRLRIQLITRVMSEKFIKKNIRLSMEFDRYIARQPKLMDKIPYKGYVVMTEKGDEKFNEQSRSLVANVRNKSKVVEAVKSGMRWTIQPLATA